MRGAGLFLGLWAVLAACTKPAAPPAQTEEAPPTALATTLKSLSFMPPCDRVVAIEWPTTWPVPLEDARGKRFKVLFYPYTGKPGSAEPWVVSTPTAEAVLDTASGGPVACKAIAGIPREVSRRRWPHQWDAEELERHEGRLFARSEAVAVSYNSSRPTTPAEAATAREYLAEFQAMAEPDLLAYYYKMNPAFWEWLRKNAGNSIPPAP